MSMAGRIRSGLPLLNRILRSDSLISQRSTLNRALLCPSVSNSEFSRNYATETKPKEEKIKVPIVLYGGVGNYASALFIAAVRAKTLETVESELLNLVQASKESPQFSQFMNDMSVPAKTRVKVMKDICSEAKMSPTATNFLVIMAENGRLKFLESIMKKFVELTMAHRKEVKATVTSVTPLPPDEEKELREVLQTLIGPGTTVMLEQKIDPNILGGLIVEYSNHVLDVSIKTRAKQMERLLRQA